MIIHLNFYQKNNLEVANRWTYNDSIENWLGIHFKIRNVW